MSIALDNFVNVSITRRDFTALETPVYDTVVYCAASGISKSGYVTSGGSAKANGTKKYPFDLSVFTKTGSDQPDAKFVSWATKFFANGGNYIHIVTSLSLLTLNLAGGGSINTLQYIDLNHSAAKTELPITEIVIVDGGNSAAFNGSLANAAQLTGRYQKIFVQEVTENGKPQTQYEGYATVYSNSTAYLAAYYTKLRLTTADNIRDYAFTAITVPTGSSINDLDNDTLVTALNNHHNVISYLAGSYRALGGDDILGNDITNLFMRIVLQQTLSVALINLLTTKIRLDTRGIISVKSTIAAELNRYIANGYISIDKAWQEEDLYIDGDLIATKGMPLPGGYAIHVSPITQTDIANHQIPQIYVLYGDQVGVRKIVLTGEVF